MFYIFRNILKKWDANSTQCSQAVTHPSTAWAQCCLTSVIGRELVCSAWYGRCLEMLPLQGFINVVSATITNWTNRISQAGLWLEVFVITPWLQSWKKKAWPSPCFVARGFLGGLGKVAEVPWDPKSPQAKNKSQLKSGQTLAGLKKATALGVPRRSPIQVLAELNAA